MSEIDEGLQHELAAPARRRGILGLRLGATALIFCGIATGSYAIAFGWVQPRRSSAQAPKKRFGHFVESFETGGTVHRRARAPTWQARRLRPFRGRLSARGAGPSAFGESGTISGISATTITVETAFGASVKVTTSASTTYSENGKTVPRSALASGEQVMLLPAAPVLSPGSTRRGHIDFCQDRRDHLAARLGQGSSVNGSVVVVAQQDGLNVTVNTSNSTVYELAGQTTASSDLKAGAEVSVTGTLSSDHDQIDATTIDIVLPSVAGRT